ncbi:MAG: class I SAM-dependent methyltransferase [Candidatus Margulisiibacteriota bacterium]
MNKQKKHARALDVMAQAEHYAQWIHAEFKPYLKGKILEIGCGIGTFSHLLENYAALDCVDLLPECIAAARAKIKDLSLVRFMAGDFLTLALPAANYDTVICINVLEHIEPDLAALEKMRGLLAGKGNLLLMVPAFHGLYGSMDKALGHCRRYDKKELLQKLLRAGFNNVTCRYLNSLGVFGWWFNGKILRRDNLSESQAIFYDRLVIPVLAKVEKIMRPPFGMSLLIIAQK